VRHAGSNIDFDHVTQGPIALSTIYTLAFTAGVKFEVKTLTVTVTPDAGQHKTYGAADPTLTYGFAPALITGDSFSGTLVRDAGEIGRASSSTRGSLATAAHYTRALA